MDNKENKSVEVKKTNNHSNRRMNNRPKEKLLKVVDICVLLLLMQ